MMEVENVTRQFTYLAADTQYVRENINGVIRDFVGIKGGEQCIFELSFGVCLNYESIHGKRDANVYHNASMRLMGTRHEFSKIMNTIYDTTITTLLTMAENRGILIHPSRFTLEVCSANCRVVEDNRDRSLSPGQTRGMTLSEYASQQSELDRFLDRMEADGITLDMYRYFQTAVRGMGNL